MNNWMKTAQFIHVRSAVHEYLREGLTLGKQPVTRKQGNSLSQKMARPVSVIPPHRWRQDTTCILARNGHHTYAQTGSAWYSPARGDIRYKDHC